MRILLVAYDNGMYINFFPQGLAYIAAVLLEEGYDVEIYHQDIHHWPYEHLTHYLDQNKYDVIGIGIIGGYYQYKKLLSISEAINRSKNRPFYIIAGHGPTPEPEYFLKKTDADVVVMGEGEITIIDLLESMQNHRPFKMVKGIAFMDGNELVVTGKRPLIENVDSIPFPAYEKFPMGYYKLFRLYYSEKTDFVMRVISGRGCKYKCNFCYRMDKGFRPRSDESIIEEIKLLKKDYGITNIIFTDDLLMSSKRRTIDFSENVIKADLGIKWDGNGRLNYAVPEVLDSMKTAGCMFINYGVEAMDDEVLRIMGKGLTTERIIKGTEATIAAGIDPGLNIIFGHIGDSKKVLERGVEFLLKYDNAFYLRTIRPVTPYPGSPLYYYAIEKGLLKDVKDFYENKHVNSDLLSVNFTDMSDEEFYQCLLEANTRLNIHYYQKQLDKMLRSTQKLYLQRDPSFRGFRQT